MASSNPDVPRPSAPEQAVAPGRFPDTIILHVLSPSPEINGGRITFPSIPLETTISHLKSRIQNSMIVPAPPNRQRLIYRGRALVNVDTTLRQVLQSELNASTDQNQSYTIHLVISPAPGSVPAHATSPSRTQASQNTSAPSPPGQTQPHPTVPPPHDHAHFPTPLHPAMAQAQAAQAMLQNQLNQLQQQIGMTFPLLQAQGQEHGHGHGHGHMHGHMHVLNQPPQMPSSLLPAPANMQAFQAVIAQQQQLRAHAGMHGIHNPAMNGMPSGMPFGHNAQGLGPITTRVHETVGPDGQRTRVVVNETTFQISRQSTPVPNTNHAEAPQAPERQHQAPAAPGPQLPPIGREEPRPHETPHLPPPPPFADGQQNYLPPLARPNFVPQATPDLRQNYSPSLPRPHYVPPPPAYVPTGLNQNRESTVSSTTAYLLSSPSGPQALVFTPGHGLFTNAPPTTQPSTRVPRPRTGLRFQQTASGRIRPQNAPNIPAPPALDGVVANAQPQQALEALVRARNAAAARQANANVDANNAILQTILSRMWTFIKLYFVIFMFTEPGSWFRWACLFVAVIISSMPPTTVFRGFAARLQAQIDGLVPAPPGPAAPPPRQQIVDGQRQGNGAADTRPGGQAEPDPVATAARLVQEHRERHPNVLRDMFERVERALGLFVASLIPGVGERHVRVREEARREIERVERERVAAVAAEEEERKKKEQEEEEEERKKQDESEVAEGSDGKTKNASADVEEAGKIETGEASTAAAAVAVSEKDQNPVVERDEKPLVEI